MRVLRFVTAALLIGALLPHATAAVVSPWLSANDLSSASGWGQAAGSVTVTTSGDHACGSSSLQLTYNVSSSMAEAGRTATPPTLPGDVLEALSLSVKGDGTYNTLWLRLEDATGEILLYRVGTLNITSWTSMTVDLSQAASYHTLGNDDGVLDYPLSLYRLVISHNGSQPASGKALVDCLQVLNGWSLPTSSARVFAPSAGEATQIHVTAGDAGDWSLTFVDELGASRAYSGMATAGASINIAWNGKTAGGTTMRGDIRGILRFDSSANGSLASTHVTAQVPYLTGAAAHDYTVSWPGSIAGVNSFLTTIGDPAEVERQARLMEDAFVRMAREEFEWKRIEPTRGYFDWPRFDQAVQIAASHQIELLGKLVYCAPWASSAPVGTSPSTAVYYPPTSVADFAAYARAVVHRYKDQVHVWEIWNEPNTSLFWKPAPSPSAYAALLKAAYTAIKAEDPTATVILGGLAGFDKSFLDGIRTAGAWGSFDALGLHTYTIGPPEPSTAAAWLDQAQAYTERYGAKPIWVTELGWSTYSGSGSGSIGVSEANQAAYLARAYLDAAQRGVRGVFWYDLIEDGTSSTSLSQNYGLVQTNGRLKPAYTALAHVAAALDQSVSVGSASPSTAGQATTISDMASTSGWSAVNLGGGWSQLTATSARHSGAGALKLDYSMGSSGTGVELRTNLTMSGSPNALSVWVYGDRSANPVYIKFKDRTGEYFQAAVGSSATRTWQRLTLYTDGYNANWKHWGGNNNGVIDYPITVTSIYVFKGTMGVTNGTIFFDDLTEHSGPNVRGGLLVGHTMNTQALYRLDGGGSTTLRVADTAAYLQYGAGYQPLSVGAGNLTSVSIGSSPVYVASHAGLSATTLTPGSGSVDFRWISGDRGIATFQVISPTHVLLRTFVADLPYDSGWRTFTWDGRYMSSGSWRTAAPGKYTLALWFHGPDGRLGLIARSVTIP